MISPPSRGKPQPPTDEKQLDPGPIVDPPVFPQIGKLDKSKCVAGKFAGRVLRVGKK
jgi:hypothetical protein